MNNVGPPTLFSIVATLLLSNDEAIKLFMVVETGEFCIDTTTMFTIVLLLTSYYSNNDWTTL